MVLELVVAESGKVDRTSPSPGGMSQLLESIRVQALAVEDMRMEQILQLKMVQLLLPGEVPVQYWKAVQESAVGVVDAEKTLPSTVAM